MKGWCRVFYSAGGIWMLALLCPQKSYVCWAVLCSKCIWKFGTSFDKAMVTNHLWLEMRPNKWLKYVLVSSCGITDITNTSTFVFFFNYLFLEQILSQIINPSFHHSLGRKAGLGMLMYFWVNVSPGVLPFLVWVPVGPDCSSAQCWHWKEVTTQLDRITPRQNNLALNSPGWRKERVPSWFCVLIACIAARSVFSGFLK